MWLEILEKVHDLGGIAASAGVGRVLFKPYVFIINLLKKLGGGAAILVCFGLQ